jgi:RND superfamily putative drug exporter
MTHSGASTVRLARWSATHPWRALAAWLVLVAAAVALAASVPVQGTTAADHRVGDSGVAERILADHDLTGPPVEQVLVTAADGSPLTAAQTGPVVADVRARLGALADVAGVGRAVRSPDGTAVIVPVTLVDAVAEDDELVQPVLDATADVQDAHPQLRVEQVGAASIGLGIDEQVGSDLASAERLSLPITLGILVLVFGALVAAAVPVLLAASSVVVTMGLYAPLSYLAPDDGTVANMVLLIGMAVGVDYSLLYLKREREERRRGLSPVDAVQVAAATAGRSVVVSGAAVMVSMAGLFVVGDPTFSSMATGAITVVAVAVVGSLTVLPAALGGLGRWVDRPRVPFLHRWSNRPGRRPLSAVVLRPVLRQPAVALALGGAAVVALALPASTLSLGVDSDADLPRSIPVVRSLDHLQAAFPDRGAELVVAVEAPAERIDAAVDALAAVDAASPLSSDDGPVVSADGEAVALTLTAAHPDGSVPVDAALADLREDLVPAAFAGLADLTPVVGGSTAEATDYVEHQADGLPWVVGFVLLLTLAMMGITFRSLPVALLTLLLEVVSVAAAFGALVLVFQEGWLAGLLGVTVTGSVITWIPLFLFVVLVGLSMDYHVFVLSRIREGVRDGLPFRTAVERGLTETAGVVTSAAVVMVAVFSIFATLSLAPMQQLGVGLAVAILLDATLVRVVLLPALLLLLGPGRIRLGGRGEPTSRPEPQAVPAPALT